MKSKIILIVILLLFQCIIIYSQPNQLKAVLASIGGYATDTQNVLITNLLGEGWAYDYIKSGLLAQGWSNSDITTMKDADATRTNIFNAIDVLPTGLNTTNFFFFGGHGNNVGIYTYNIPIQPYPNNGQFLTNIEQISPSELQSQLDEKNYCAFIEACNSGIFTQMTNGYVATSCESNESSYGPAGGGVGYFTSALSYTLRWGPFQKGSITAEDLFNYAAPITVSSSQGAQNPETNSHTNGSLLLTIPAYNVYIENKFTGLLNQGLIEIDGTTTTLPENARREYFGTNMLLESVNQTINGITYTFSHWEDNTVNYTRTIQINNEVNPQAFFIGRPSNYCDSISFGNSVGAPVVINWTDNTNTNVTQYQIWRKVKHNGVMGSPELLTTVGRGVQTYTDDLYLLTSTYSNDLLYYDVRAYYAIEETYSTEDWKSVYGEINWSKDSNENIAAASLANEVPTDYSISNYPNPFNPTTVINYQLPKDGFVTLKVYNVIGKEIATLVNSNKNAGYYNVEFDASNLPSGVYIYSINANGFKQSKKMILTK